MTSDPIKRPASEIERLRRDLEGAHSAADWNAKVVAERDAEIERLRAEVKRLKRALALDAIAETDGKLLD